MITKSMRVGVLLGGISAERPISLKTGKAVATALRDQGYAQVLEIDVDRDIFARLRDLAIEVAFIALHGKFGEDGTIQGILEYLEIPYTGCGVLGSAVAMDKVLSKDLFRAHGLRTPKGFVAKSNTGTDEILKMAESIGYPLIVKPSREGSTLGLSLVNSPSEVETAQKKALQHDRNVLWEEKITGKELTVGFLHGSPLPIVEIVPKGGLFDFDAKYTKGQTDYFSPARMDALTTKTVQDFAKRAFEAVGADSFGRVDVLLDEMGPCVLEVNTIPGMTATSLVPMAAQAAGISFGSLVEMILQDARLKQ